MKKGYNLWRKKQLLWCYWTLEKLGEIFTDWCYRRRIQVAGYDEEPIPPFTGITQNMAFAKIHYERTRQHLKFGADPLATDSQMVTILGEEFGEVCKAVCQGEPWPALESELVQVAAVCVAALEKDLHWGLQP